MRTDCTLSSLGVGGTHRASRPRGGPFRLAEIAHAPCDELARPARAAAAPRDAVHEPRGGVLPEAAASTRDERDLVVRLRLRLRRARWRPAGALHLDDLGGTRQSASALRLRPAGSPRMPPARAADTARPRSPPTTSVPPRRTGLIPRPRERLAERLAERPYVARRDGQARATVSDHVRDPPDAAGHHRAANGPCLEHHVEGAGCPARERRQIGRCGGFVCEGALKEPGPRALPRICTFDPGFSPASHRAMLIDIARLSALR
jgi:hypothetical protein